MERQHDNFIWISKLPTFGALRGVVSIVRVEGKRLLWVVEDCLFMGMNECFGESLGNVFYIIGGVMFFI